MEEPAAEGGSRSEVILVEELRFANFQREFGSLVKMQCGL